MVGGVHYDMASTDLVSNRMHPRIVMRAKSFDPTDQPGNWPIYVVMVRGIIRPTFRSILCSSWVPSVNV